MQMYEELWKIHYFYEKHIEINTAVCKQLL